MTKNVKLITALSLSAITFGAFLTLSQNNINVKAAQTLVGNHYIERVATFSESGTKEYWIDCDSHKHYLSYEKGTWAEAGKAPEVLPDDDRYIPALVQDELPTEEEAMETYVEVKTEGHSTTITVVDSAGEDTGLKIEPTNKNEEQYEVVGYEGDSSTVIIPEGVKTMEAWRKVFDGSVNNNAENIKTIIVASTVETLQVNAFNNLPNLETIIIKASTVEFGFVKNCPKLKNVYIYKSVKTIQGQAFNQARCSNDLTISTECLTAKKDWSPDWNRIDWQNGGRFYTVNWGIAY